MKGYRSGKVVEVIVKTFSSDTHGSKSSSTNRGRGKDDEAADGATNAAGSGTTTRQYTQIRVVKHRKPTRPWRRPMGRSTPATESQITQKYAQLYQAPQARIDTRKSWRVNSRFPGHQQQPSLPHSRFLRLPHPSHRSRTSRQAHLRHHHHHKYPPPRRIWRNRCFGAVHIEHSYHLRRCRTPRDLRDLRDLRWRKRPGGGSKTPHTRP